MGVVFAELAGDWSRNLAHESMDFAKVDEAHFKSQMTCHLFSPGDVQSADMLRKVNLHVSVILLYTCHYRKIIPFR